MSTKTLFLAWQDGQHTHQWFPVGQLDADVKSSDYHFRYIEGANRAKEEAGFPPLLEFPELKKVYKSKALFPIFMNRVIAPKRPDRADYLHNLDLSEPADPMEILSVNGGHRVTDTYEVFPKIEKSADGSFSCRFFLHGWAHTNPEARERINKLEQNDPLLVTLELNNPATGLAVQIQTEDYYMIGWAPRYLVYDLTMAIADSLGECKANVVRINPQPAPSKQRVLIEMRGRWDNNYVPMNGPDFVPLA